MTDTERIATALLGWKYMGVGRYGSKFSNLKSQDAWVNRATGESVDCDFDGPWPNFTTLDGCRVFEDALTTRRLLGQYRIALLDLAKVEYYEHEEYSFNPMSWACWVLLRATSAQRVDACIRVIDKARL